ncbi:AI-2E family transporter [Hyphomicrobium sp.]|uniref:AI-2E family transporter n=1 Tax=Hyphomicrobium sp. TaxID=82 RepID=UPI0025BECE4C|nr:AI-2E family transporter [Hyphomicrobium sp.]MCC7251444.1 AI-2E family transporter [Hyphomicrobium sp.]
MTLAAEATSQSRQRANDGEVLEKEPEEKSAAETWQLVADVSVTGLFALALLAALYLMKEVFVPVILAWVVANILLPVVAWMEKRGLPRVASVAAVTLALVAVLLTVAALLSLPLTYWLGRATELGALIREKLQSITEPLDFLRELTNAVGQATGQASGSGLHVEESTNIVSGIVAFLTPAVTQGILFLGALVFYMIYQKQIKNRSVLILPSREARLTALRIFADIERNTTVYFGTFTIVNLCLGLATTILAYVVGLPNPMLWGVLAAVLNYIPYIGPAIMVAVLFLIGLFTFPSISEAVVAPLVYVVMTAVEGHFLTPALMGRRMTLNPFAVFLAIGFWTWMWGPIGAFVAVPILMTTMVTFRHLFPEDAPELPG